jgi:hypothetical protein
VTGIRPPETSTDPEIPAEWTDFSGQGHFEIVFRVPASVRGPIVNRHLADVSFHYNGAELDKDEIVVTPYLLLAETLPGQGGSPGVGAKLQDGSPAAYGEVLEGGVKMLPAYFVRGNVDNSMVVAPDGREVYILDLADVRMLMDSIFLGRGVLPCQDAADVNDDGVVDLTDGILLLNHLFRSGAPPAYPHPRPGFDANATDALDCESPLPLFRPLTGF